MGKKNLSTVGHSLADLAKVEPVNSGLPPRLNIPGVGDVAAAKARAEARTKEVETWLHGFRSEAQMAIPYLFGLVGTSSQQKEVREWLRQVFATTEGALRVKAQWTYARVLVERGGSLGINLFQVLADLTERGILESADWPTDPTGKPDDKFRPESHYLRLGRRYWSPARLEPSVYCELRNTVSAVFLALRHMAERGREEKASRYAEERRAFCEGASRDLQALFSGKEGKVTPNGKKEERGTTVFVIDVPPPQKNGRYQGGILKIQLSQGKVTVIDAFGPFAGYVQQKIIGVAAPYPIEAVKEERLELPMRVTKPTFQATLWLHLALRRAKFQWEKVTAVRARCLALASEATVPVDAWLLDGAVGKAFIRLSKFKVAKRSTDGKPVTTTLHQVGVVVERVFGKGKTKIRLLKAVNDDGLFDAVVGEKIYDEFSVDPAFADQPFSGLPPVLRRFLTVARNKVERARERATEEERLAALRAFAEGEDDEEPDDVNGNEEAEANAT